ncbi:MAG: NAD-glutamate dehydrogenase, partial [Burkholderiaceae bacterium]
FIRFLEKRGALNRAIEFLPSDDEIDERRAKDISLTGPERAVLLAYSKMWLFDELLASDLPEDPWVGTAAARYFPSALKEKFGPYIDRHPLKREIVATHVLNSMVNRVGSTFVHRRMETAGATPAQVVRAYLLTRETFGLVPVWQAIEALDNVVPDQLQSQMVIELGRRTVRATTWFLRSRRLAEPMTGTIERFAPAAAALLQYIAATPAGTPWRAAITQHEQALVAKGVPPPLALAVAGSDTSFAALDVTEVSESSKQPLAVVANTYFSIGELLGLARLRMQVSALSSNGYWQSMAKSALADDLAALQRELTADALQAGGQSAWELSQRPAVERAQRMLTELADTKAADLAMLSVALRELRHLA